MKQRTKVLSVVMAILLTLGSILSPLSMSVEAQDVTDASKYRIVLDIQQMGPGRTSFPFGYKNYHCETNGTQIIASAGYTNVITYCADADGYLRVDDFNVELKGTDKQREVEFAVVDDAGVILTNQGKVITVNSDNPKEGLNIEAFEVKNGESIHFVFHGVIENANSLRCSTKIMYSADGEKWVQKNSTGKLWASVNTNTSAEQGAEGLYYNYSTTYVKEEIKQDSVGIVYKDMRDGRSERADFPFMHVKNACMTNDIQIIAGKEYTNVVAYQMPSDGKIKVEELEVWLLNTKVDRTVEFAVIDSSGKVLSNNGKIIVLNNTNTTKSGMTIDAQDMKQGERLYFVFHGIEGGDNPIRCSAKIMRNTDGSTWTQANQYIYNGKPLVWPANTTLDGYEQGVENFYYGYSDVYVTHEYTAPSTQEPDIPTVPNVPELPTPGDEGTPKYKIDFEAAEMERTTVPSASWWTMPNGVWNCMTNSSGQKVVSPGYVNIITYKANKAGTITLKNMTASVNVTNAPENVVLFAITDKEGNILYPADETLTVLNKDNQKITGVFLENCPIEENDEINFIFEGVVGTTASCWLEGTIVHTDIEGNETILEREDKIIGLNVDEEQGTNGFYYRYANKFQNNVIGHVTPSEPDNSDDTQEPTQPTTPIVPGTATVPEKNKDGHMPTYKINFEARNMEACNVKNFPWFMPNTEYDCMTNPLGNQIVSKGYANILTYKAQKAGELSLEGMTAGINIKDQPENVAVLFAITDKDGNILYPSDGTLAVLNKDNQEITGTFLSNHKVKEGDELNFIFQGVEGKTVSCRVRGMMFYTDSEGKRTRISRESGGYIAPLSGSTEQGAEGFYYRYAKTFKNDQIGYVVPPAPEVIPGTATIPKANAEGHMPMYRIDFEAADMVASTVHKLFPWSMPDKEYDCMTNPAGNQIVSKGYANIITYKAQKAGTLTLKNMTAGINVTNAPENAVLFAITDKEGNVLYPADGTLAVLNKDNATITGTFLKDYKVEKGDEINFIFEGVEGKTIACRIRGILVHTDSEGKETRLTREDGGYIAPISGSTAQGADGFSYRYAKKFENVILGYVAPKSKAVQWGEGIQVAVSNNPDDFVYYETTTGEEATEKVDMLEIIKLGVELRYKFIPWIIVAVSGVVFGTQWVVFLIKRRKGVKQNEENS